MADLLKRVSNFIDQHRLFQQSDRLLVGVSGGIDSTVLAHVLMELGYQIGIAHVNYQLRGAASDEDAVFVENLARSLDSEFVGKTEDVAQAKAPGESTQMVARRLRFEHFKKTLDEYNYEVIVLAHHLDDQLETTLLNLIRSTGIRGLAGMLPRQGNICRPLLCLSRLEILAYAEANNVAWREDATNATDDYLRNRIRHRLSPVLKELGLTSKSHAKTIEHLWASRRIYEEGIATKIKELPIKNEGKLSINIQALRQEAIGQTYLFELVNPYGFTVEQARQIYAAKQPLRLQAGDHKLELRDGWLTVRGSSLTAEPLPELLITELPYEFSSGGKTYGLTWQPRPESLNQAGCQFIGGIPYPGAGSPLSPTLHLRPRKNGDRIQPLGMAGKTRKLKAIFTDRKEASWLRDRHYLLCKDDDEILAIPGVLVTEPGKVGQEEWVLQIETK